MEIKTLCRGEDRAVVEAGSQAEADMRALGFVDGEAEQSADGKHQPIEDDEFSKAELVKLAHKHGVDAGGTKADLVARINAKLAGEA